MKAHVTMLRKGKESTVVGSRTRVEPANGFPLTADF